MSNFEQLKYIDTIPKSEKIKRQIWVVIYTILFRPTPRGMMHGWRKMLLRMFGARIGQGSKIAPSCFVWAPWNLEMGDFSVLGDNVDCYTMAKISIGSKVAVSQRSFLCAGTHDIASLKRPLVTKPITIGNHVWIAAETMVGPGVSIGEGSVISARSFVNKDMPAWMVCAGTPCKPIKARVIENI